VAAPQTNKMIENQLDRLAQNPPMTILVVIKSDSNNEMLYGAM